MADTEAAELLAKAMALPPATRLALADELMDSVEGPASESWAKAWTDELNRRVKALRAGELETVPAADAIERVRAKLRR